MNWQVQEAKQRFSEVLRAVEKDGPQTITRHGEEVAVVIDIVEFRRLKAASGRDAIAVMLSAPDDDFADVMDEVVAERKAVPDRVFEFDA